MPTPGPAARQTGSPDLKRVDQTYRSPRCLRRGTWPKTLSTPLRLPTPIGERALFSIAAHVQTAADVTLEELSIESFYPADEATASALRDQ